MGPMCQHLLFSLTSAGLFAAKTLSSYVQVSFNETVQHILLLLNAPQPQGRWPSSRKNTVKNSMRGHMRAGISEQSLHHVTLMRFYFFFSGFFCDERS